MSRRRRSSNPISFFAFQDVMIGTIGVVLIVTVLLLIQIGHKTSQAVAAASDAPRQEQIATLTLHIAALRALPDPDALTAELQRLLRAVDLEQLRNGRRAVLLADLTHAMEDDAREAAQSGAELEAQRLAVRAELLRAELEQERLRREISYLIADEDSRAVVAELSGARVVLSSTAASDAPSALSSEDPDVLARATLEAWAAQADGAPSHLLLSLKPSGIAVWNAIERLRVSDPRFRDLQVGVDLIPEDASTTSQFRGGKTQP